MLVSILKLISSAATPIFAPLLVLEQESISKVADLEQPMAELERD